ncbi:MAG TPA: DUF433 domain-containing protein [Pirellulales bacterium]|jgi:uncharacterized protein (DUF433 family)|nr:DUF433 domain-containing protein [Pirellulales bacterium]
MTRLRFDPRNIASDPRDMPAYSLPEAARCLQLPEATLRSWTLGRNYKTERGQRRFKPLITLPDRHTRLLSFFNLAEAHVLSAFRRHHGVRLAHIRSALNYVSKKFGSPHPLIDQRFETDGAKLFIRELGKLVDASAYGQVVMEEVLSHLERFDREDQVVARLYPFTRSRSMPSPRCVLIDPRFSFGRPVLSQSHAATAVIAERYRAGESVDELADDYGCKRLEIEEALRYELRLEAA